MSYELYMQDIETYQLWMNEEANYREALEWIEILGYNPGFLI